MQLHRDPARRIGFRQALQARREGRIRQIRELAEAVIGQQAAVFNTEGGWARLMNPGLTKEQIAKLPLEKYLGERGWTDPEEWM